MMNPAECLHKFKNMNLSAVISAAGITFMPRSIGFRYICSSLSAKIYVYDAWECDTLTTKHLNCISSVVLSIKVVFSAIPSNAMHPKTL